MRRMKIVELFTRDENVGSVAVRWTGEYDMENRPTYEWMIADADGMTVSEASDLRGPVGAHVDADREFLSLCSFIGAGVEARQSGNRESENWSAISDELWAWMERTGADDLIALAALDLEPPEQARGAIEL